MIKNHRMAFYYGQTKETGTSSTNDGRKKKDLLGRTIKEMMEAEIDNHLGYKKSFPCMQKE